MAEDDRRNLFPGALEMMILQILRRRSLHGYALAQHLKQASDDLLRIEEGSLYPALQRMLREGLVEAEWARSETNRRVRRYRITPAGRRQLAREVSRFDRMLQGIARVMRPAES
jgi:PadR family transcriptional regulator PadR